MRAGAADVLQGDEHVVVGRVLGPAAVDLGEDRPHGSEQHHGLVDQVTAQIEEEPARLTGVVALAPAPAERRPPPLEARLETTYVAERTRGDQGLQGAEVGVPPTVLERAEQDPRGPGLLDQRAALGCGRCQRLVDDDGDPGGEGGAREGDVGVVGAGHHEQIQVQAQQGVDVWDHRGVGVVGGDRRGAVRGAGDHPDELHAGGRRDQRGVEDGTCQAVPGDADADHASPCCPRTAMKVVSAPSKKASSSPTIW